MRGLIFVALLVLMIASLWKLFTKAGQPGWTAVIPLWNLFVIMEIAGKPLGWAFLLMLPIVGVYFTILTCIAFSKKFGKSVEFGVGLCVLPFIFLPALAFSNAKFRGTVDQTTS
jgi:hypothetical protein